MSTQNTFSFPKHIGRLLQVFEPVPEEEAPGELLLYEAGGTLLNNQIPPNYGYWSQKQQPEVGVLGQEKHLNQDHHHHHHHHQFLNINAQVLPNSIQLSTINSHANAFSSTITSPTSAHMLLSNPASSHVRGFHSRIPVALESQGLSLSLSSSLQNLETTKLEELREENDGMFFTNQGGSVGDSLNPHGSNNLGRSDDHRHPLHEESTVLDGHGHGHGQVEVGFGIGTSFETVNVLRNSKYFKPAQELLEQLCPVGRVQFKDHRLKEHHTNPNSSTVYCSGVGSSSLKEHPPLSAADEKEHQRRRVKLLSMLDEVDTRYRNYCENMQAMVGWFDSVMGFGDAMTYTNLGRKAISQHFRRTKDAIVVQLKLTCELLGEKDTVLTGKSGLTKGETPRLRLVAQSLRTQKALHYMGMTGLEACRPLRSLPERSVNTLRAWLFEHFLHPYPRDADKHYLSRQTGLSKNQVSNWFINARVRLWKPMVEEMYQQDTKEEEDSAGKGVIKSSEPNSSADHSGNLSAQAPMRGTTTASDPPPPPLGGGKSSNANATEKDPSQNTINCRQYTLGNQLMLQVTQEPEFFNWGMTVDDVCCHAGIAEIGNISAGADVASSLVTFGTPAGDVSLTLGLPQTGNVPEKSHLSVGNFGACGNLNLFRN